MAYTQCSAAHIGTKPITCQEEAHLNISTIPDIHSHPVIRLCNGLEDISGEQQAQIAMEPLLLPEDIIEVGPGVPERSHTHVPADTRSISDTGKGLDGNWYELLGYSEATSDIDNFFVQMLHKCFAACPCSLIHCPLLDYAT